MNILITGFAGFTGTHFIKFAESFGHNYIKLNVDLRDRFSTQKVISKESFDVVNACSGISHLIQSVLDKLSQVTGNSIEIEIDKGLGRPDDQGVIFGLPGVQFDLISKQNLLLLTIS